MEFKKGDRVIYIGNDDKYNILKLHKQYIIESIDYNYIDTYVMLKNTPDNFLFNIIGFILDKKYYRKQKIKQIRNGISNR